MRQRIDTYTDNTGREFKRPVRADFASDIEWLRADCAFSDRMASVASAAFDRQFKASMRRGR